MMLTTTVLFRAAALVATILQLSAASFRLRTANVNNDHRNLRPQTKDCVVMVIADTSLLCHSETHKELEEFLCEVDPADNNGQAKHTLPIKASDAQMQVLKKLLNDGDLVPGFSTLNIPNTIISPGVGVFIPPGQEIKLGTPAANSDNHHRKLAVVTGNKYMLAVKVADSVGKKRSETPQAISYDFFGPSSNDAVNMKSQFFDCSWEQLNILPGPDPNRVAGNYEQAEVAPGVIEVTIDVSLQDNTRSTIRNAITTAIQAKLGITLPGPFDHVLYVLEACYVDCGWAAYAYINSWNSVYQGGYYKQAGVQIHEIGHNLNLAHSGGLDGQTYTDHTCLMGNPLYGDDLGRMCYNPAKNWQIGWYPANHVLLDPVATPSWTGTLIGVAEWKTNVNNLPVVIKIESGTATDAFVGFNRAIGMNDQNDEADDAVTIVETGNNGVGYSQSYLKAKLYGGQSQTIPNWQGTGRDLTVSVHSINLGTTPGTASITITAINPSSSPTPVPTPAPTASPTPMPTPAPTPPVPTPAPTPSPTTPPTPAPTPSPTTVCSTYTSGGLCKKAAGCTWFQGACF